MKINYVKEVVKKALNLVTVTSKQAFIYKFEEGLDITIETSKFLNDVPMVIVSRGDTEEEVLQLCIETFSIEDIEEYYSNEMQSIISTREVLKSALKLANKAEIEVDIKADLKLNDLNFGTLKLDKGILRNLLTLLEAKKEQLVMNRAGGYREWNHYLKSI